MTRFPTWLALTALLIVWALWVLIAGGVFIEWRGWRLSSRQADRPAIAVVLVVAIAIWRRGLTGVRRDLAAARIDVDRWAQPLAVGLSLATLVVGLTWGTRIAGGADSYGYVSQARLWAQGSLIVEQAFVADVPWPRADETFAPLGYRPWPDGPAIVPVYAPGLPMLMALFSFIADDAVFWVVPLAGAGVVFLSFLLGRALDAPATGLIAAALMATSPAFLFQLVAPMSDVVVAAFWAAALVLAIANRRDRWLGSGLASALAVLTRPNTVPVAIVFAIGALLAPGGRAGLRPRVMNALAYATGLLPGALSVAAIHTALYGSPLESGYGSLGGLYGWANLGTNLLRYSTWLITSETPVICLAAAAPFLIRRSREVAWQIRLTLSLAAAMWLCYGFYIPFDVWWYLRFLLTSFPSLLALTAIALARLLQAPPSAWRLPVAFALLAPLLVWRIDFAREHGTFDSWRYERRYAETGRVVAAQLPPNAVLFSMQQSGSLRFYSGRLTLRWTPLDPAWLDRAIAVLEQRGLKPYFVLEEPEEREFRQWFGGHSRLARLDWPPLVELPTVPTVRIYDPRQAGQ